MTVNKLWEQLITIRPITVRLRVQKPKVKRYKTVKFTRNAL